MGVAAIFMVIPWLLIGSIPIALLVIVLVRSLTLPRGVRAATPAVCGRCRHEIAQGTDTAAGLPHLCPECGTPYRLGGVLTLNLVKKTRPGMVSAILSWTVLMFLLTSFSAGVAATVSSYSSVSNFQQRFTQTVAAVRTDGGQPTSDPGYSLRYEGELTFQPGMAATAGTLTITVRPDSGPAVRAEIDTANNSWAIPASGDSGSVFDHAAAARVLRAAGIDTTTAFAAFEATRLSETVAFIRRDPFTAMNDVLATNSSPLGMPQGFPGRQTAAVTSWYPVNLVVTDQRGSAASGLEFDFEADTIDRHYTGSVSGEEFVGSIRFECATAADGTLSLREVTVTLSPPEGWPATLVYDPVGLTATVTRDQDTTQTSVTGPGEALLALSEKAGIAAPGGVLDPGLVNLSALIEEIRVVPVRYDASPSTGLSAGQTGGQTGGGTPAPPSFGTPPGDGLPDGGLETTVPASTQFVTSPMMQSFPMGIMIALGAGAILWAGGLILIIFRRLRLYPEAVLATGNPASSAS